MQIIAVDEKNRLQLKNQEKNCLKNTIIKNTVFDKTKAIITDYYTFLIFQHCTYQNPSFQYLYLVSKGSGISR